MWPRGCEYHDGMWHAEIDGKILSFATAKEAKAEIDLHQMIKRGET